MPSDALPQPATGQQSTNSPESSPGQEAREDELLKSIDVDQGLTRLTRLAGVKSLICGMKAETRETERDADYAHAALWGVDVKERPAGDEEMEVLSGRDVKVETHHHHAPPAPAGMSTLAKMAVAGLAATGVGLPIAGAIALPEIIKAFNPPAVTQPAFDPNDFDLMVGPPKETPQ